MKIEKKKKSHKNIFIYYIGHVTVKDLRYVKTNSANSVYLITLVPINESKDTLKSMKNYGPK